MAKLPNQLLAESLGRARKSAARGIIRANNITRTDLERLELNGWLTRIIRGWYLLKQPGLVREGDSTAWYSSFWDFISVYLQSRFKDNYCLSASSSMDVHIGCTAIPKQLFVMAKKGGSSLLDLPFNTSLVIYQEIKTFPTVIEQRHDINVMSLAEALYRAAPTFFQKQPDDAEIALKLVDMTSLSRELLSGKNMASAERIIGAYDFLKEHSRAKHLQNDLVAAGYQPEPSNPFIIKAPSLLDSRIHSPYAARIKIMWQQMRSEVIALFPVEPGLPRASIKYFKELEKIYANDAYNSLSIEGYEVSEELIMKIANGNWNPDQSLNDKQQINAMAAKGYREAFNKVKQSIDRILHKNNSGEVVKEDLHTWYSALFSPSVKSGIINPSQLAGYRNHPVYIRNSMHTPLPVHALTDAMETLFDCLTNESHAAVRAVLGHFVFVFIHPYMDGNGRIGRFLMNSFFASGGFPWTIVHVNHRKQYINALEKASVEQDIKPFAKFILSEMQL